MTHRIVLFCYMLSVLRKYIKIEHYSTSLNIKCRFFFLFMKDAVLGSTCQSSRHPAIIVSLSNARAR